MMTIVSHNELPIGYSFSVVFYKNGEKAHLENCQFRSGDCVIDFNDPDTPKNLDEFEFIVTGNVGVRYKFDQLMTGCEKIKSLMTDGCVCESVYNPVGSLKCPLWKLGMLLYSCCNVMITVTIFYHDTDKTF